MKAISLGKLVINKQLLNYLRKEVISLLSYQLITWKKLSIQYKKAEEKKEDGLGK